MSPDGCVCGSEATGGLANEEGELVEVLEGDAGATGDGAQGVVGNVDLQLGLRRDTLVQSAEQRAAASQIDTRAVNIGGQLRRSGRKGVENGLLDAGDRLIQGVGNLLVVNRNLLGQTGQQVAAQGGVVLWGFVQLAYGGARQCARR